MARRLPLGAEVFGRFHQPCAEELQPLTLGRKIAQINHTLSERQGTVRGMHFQYPPYAEIKFVICTRGKVFDVAVDLRKGSSTFLRWHAEVLSSEDHDTLVIPEGFAHGFQTMVDGCEMLYLHTRSHQPGYEGAVNAHDPRLGIQWPQPTTEMSTRDASHKMLAADFVGLAV